MSAARRGFIVFGAPRIAPDEIKRVAAVLRGGWIGTGPRVAAFEEAFRRFTGARNLVAVGSGTSALHLALLVGGVRRGDEVVTTPMTFAATANAVIHAGARPVFADVDRETGNLDPEMAARAVTRRTRALLPVHLAGRPCDLDAFSALARRRGLKLVEDASHAIEALWRGRHAGTVGDFGCFSFTHNKNLTAGEGGAVAARSARAAALVRTLASQGMTAGAWQRFRKRSGDGYRVVVPGFKYGMSDINAAIAIGQLRKVPRWQLRRRAIWEYYSQKLAGLPTSLPNARVPRGRHALHMYMVRLRLESLRTDRDGIRHAMAERGVGTGVHYVSLHLQPYYRKALGLAPRDFPNALWISERTLSLPFSPHLTDSQVERVARTFRGVLGKAVRAA